jgi:hypothetical protein
MHHLDAVLLKRCYGSEPFHSKTSPLNFTLLDFWSWSTSDLLSNATRGRIAEFIVAKACNIPTNGINDVRDEWAAFDLETMHGIRIEVKSAAYLQSWCQKGESPISFSIRETRTFDRKTGELSAKPTRPAKVYVFALLAHQEKGTVEPLDVDQWEFYVLAAATLNARERSQYSITLPSLRELKAGPYKYHQLFQAVETAASSLP